MRAHILVRLKQLDRVIGNLSKETPMVAYASNLFIEHKMLYYISVKVKLAFERQNVLTGIYLDSQSLYATFGCSSSEIKMKRTNIVPVNQPSSTVKRKPHLKAYLTILVVLLAFLPDIHSCDFFTAILHSSRYSEPTAANSKSLNLLLVLSLFAIKKEVEKKRAIVIEQHNLILKHCFVLY